MAGLAIAPKVLTRRFLAIATKVLTRRFCAGERVMEREPARLGIGV
ncbi:hypothetical protein HMPREF0541_01820, partial [Lacticaseibacillus rhamnosus ATCC 21052]